MQYIVKIWYEFGVFNGLRNFFIAVDLKKPPDEEYALSVNYGWSSGILCCSKWRKQLNYVNTVCCKKAWAKNK